MRINDLIGKFDVIVIAHSVTSSERKTIKRIRNRFKDSYKPETVKLEIEPYLDKAISTVKDNPDDKKYKYKMSFYIRCDGKSQEYVLSQFQIISDYVISVLEEHRCEFPEEPFSYDCWSKLISKAL